MAVFRDLPSIINDSGATNNRVGPYGETHVIPVSAGHQGVADEGAHFVAINPTAGTGIIGHAAPTTFDEAKPFLLLYNSNTSKRVFLNSIHLVKSVVEVGSTRVQWNFSTDVGNRYSSAGAGLTINNTSSVSTVVSGVNAYAGAVVGTAVTSSRRLLGNYVVKGANVGVVWDVEEFIFGVPAGATTSAVEPTSGATRFTTYLPPVVLGPLHTFAAVQWAASQSTGPTYEIVVSFSVR